MKKIITAINNPNLNEKLKDEKNFNIVCKDIQYKEAILEILTEYKDIDIIIINNNLPGEIETEKLIKKIKLINEKIKIIYILEKENKRIEEKLKELNINNIYYNSEINIEKLIKIINQEKNNSEEEIKKELNELKKIILENNLKIEKNNNKNNKNKEIKKEINKINNKKIKENIKNKLNKLFKKENLNNKIITISGPANVGKTITTINIAKILEKNSKKILIIDFDINKSNIHTFLGIKKYSKKINKNKIIEIIIENNIQKTLENLLIKYNKKINLISGLKIFFENKEIFNEKNLKLFFYEMFEYLKKIYDFILIDIGSENEKYLNNEILKNSDLNFLLIEGNLAGINKAKIFLNKFNYENDFKIIINKKDKYCIDLKILKNIFENKNKIEEIKYNKLFSNLINKNYKNIYLNKKINLEKNYKNIIKKII